MKLGHEYYFQHKMDDASQAYSKARQIFSALRDEWETRYAQHWIGYCYYEQGKTQQSLLILEELARSLRKDNQQWLLMRTFQLLSSGNHNLNEYSKAINYNRQALSLDLYSKREYTDMVLSSMGGIGKMHFSHYKNLLKLSDDALELADRHAIEEKKLRYVLQLAPNLHGEIMRQIVDFKHRSIQN